MRLLFLLTLVSLFASLLTMLPVQAEETISPQTLAQALVLPPVGHGGRAAVHADALEAQIVAGQTIAPKEGDKVLLPDNTSQTWAAVTADKDGNFSGPALEGGYAYFTVDSPNARVMLLDASGDDMVYVNGEPRIGDPYQSGWTRLPILLHSGTNTLLFKCSRGALKVQLSPVTSPAMLNTRDMTLPDWIIGHDKDPLWASVVVVNTTAQPITGLKLSAQRPGGRTQRTSLPILPPLSLRKVAFELPGGTPKSAGDNPVTIQLSQQDKSLDTAKISVRARKPNQTYKRTFISEIDGSVQYYAVNPAQSPDAKALLLTLHGASVEGLGQADAYESKSWINIVAPTNRRPYGFDWEDWGRLDAMEVLSLAKAVLKPDPHRIYLAGHSMGGHGTWQIGATFPDQFAAICPSAGWVSFFSYGGSSRIDHPTPVQSLVERAMAPSDTLTLAHNYANEGVYIIHGSADDNVPVTEAQGMVKLLSTFHHDFDYHEQPGAGHWWDASPEPGADCVDLVSLFDFFAHHARPTDDQVRQVNFVTASPGVSAWCDWACIAQQTHSLQPSTIHLECDPGLRQFAGTTENVDRLGLRLTPITASDPISVTLDGQTLSKIPWPTGADQTLWLQQTGGHWAVSMAPAPAEKTPMRYGTFKDAFRHHMLFVYGTHGTLDENAWAFAKARYDAENFWYRGNGSIDVVADSTFDPNKDRDRSVILYGNRDTNSAWSPLLGTSPIQITEGTAKIGTRQETGDDLTCLFLRPRPGSDIASVGVVSGTGIRGMRLTDRLSYFSSGTAYPDFLLLGPETLSSGIGGIRAAGYFGNDWSLETGDLAWREADTK